MTELERLKQAVVAVGDGYGAVVNAALSADYWSWERKPISRVVVTAAQCLPDLPPSRLVQYQFRPNHRGLVHLIDQDPDDRVEAEVIFVDPVADIAVLAEPWLGGSEGFRDIVNAGPAFDICTAYGKGSHLRVLSKEFYWLDARLSRRFRGHFHIGDAEEALQEWMSGLPVVDWFGQLVAVIGNCPGEDDLPDAEEGDWQHYLRHAVLPRDLPVWLVEAMIAARRFSD